MFLRAFIALDLSAKCTKPILLFSCPDFAGGKTTFVIFPWCSKSCFSWSWVMFFGKFFTYTAFTCMRQQEVWGDQIQPSKNNTPHNKLQHNAGKHTSIALVYEMKDHTFSVWYVNFFFFLFILLFFLSWSGHRFFPSGNHVFMKDNSSITFQSWDGNDHPIDLM